MTVQYTPYHQHHRQYHYHQHHHHLLTDGLGFHYHEQQHRLNFFTITVVVVVIAIIIIHLRLSLGMQMMIVKTSEAASVRDYTSLNCYHLQISNPARCFCRVELHNSDPTGLASLLSSGPPSLATAINQSIETL